MILMSGLLLGVDFVWFNDEYRLIIGMFYVKLFLLFN